MSKDLTLNNGAKATYIYTDFWSRPVYEIDLPSGATAKVCCTELDGTHLHTYNSEWEEPISPLKQEYQPAPEQPQGAQTNSQ